MNAISESEFLELVESNQNLIHKVCNMYVDNDEDRRDLFQEIMLQLWLSYPTFKGNSKLTTWMYKIALYTAISVFRKAKRKERHHQMLLAEKPPATSELHHLEENDIDILQICIAKLSKADKALMLLYLEEYSYRDIAEIVGISESNVGVRINRIKKKLKELFKSAEHE